MLIQTLADVKSAINNAVGDTSFVWLGKRASDCHGLEVILPNLGFIVGANYSPEELLTNGRQFISLEQQEGRRQVWSTSMLDAFLKSSLTKDVQIPRGALIVAYSSTHELEILSRSQGWRVLCVSQTLKATVADKFALPDVLKDLGLPVIPSTVLNYGLSDNTFDSLQTAFNGSFVVQIKAGSSGKGTYICRDSNDYELAGMHLGNSRQPLKASKFIEGPSLNINAVVLKTGEVLLSPFSYQAIGQPELTPSTAGYGGNDWFVAQQLPDDIKTSLYDQTIKFGKHLYEKGYLGHFGIDFIADLWDGVVYILEVNARMQGSSPTNRQLMMENDEIPLIAFHIMDWLGIDYDYDVTGHNIRVRRTSFDAFQLLILSRELTTAVVQNQVFQGVYRWNPDFGLEYLRGGWHIGHVRNHEFLINCGVPPRGLHIETGARLVKVQGRFQMLDPNGRLLPDAQQLINEIYRSFGMTIFQTYSEEVSAI